MKFDIGEFHQDLSSHFNFRLCKAVLMTAVHEDPHAFLLIKCIPAQKMFRSKVVEKQKVQNSCFA